MRRPTRRSQLLAPPPVVTGALRAPLAFSPPEYLRQGAAVMPPQRFAARDAHVPRAQSPRGRESDSLDVLQAMMAMFREQSEASERLRREERERC